MKVKNLSQHATIPAAPSAVYHALVNAGEHAAFSGGSAKIGKKPGAPFSMYDGSLEGFILAHHKPKEIVWAWRADSWPERHYSIARFKLTKAGKGTRIEFAQYGIPASSFASISEGWKEYYWKALVRHFSK
ncbi:MAG: SRPBCC domain-containing protein [Thermoplasmata archaeon]|nr:SRPBCC domain-containing protein [Thermoplasmata archaeon]